VHIKSYVCGKAKISNNLEQREYNTIVCLKLRFTC